MRFILKRRGFPSACGSGFQAGGFLAGRRQRETACWKPGAGATGPAVALAYPTPASVCSHRRLLGFTRRRGGTEEQPLAALNSGNDLACPNRPLAALRASVPPCDQLPAVCRREWRQSRFLPWSSRSGVSLPTRWTFPSAIVASAHCLSAALRHPGFACFQSSLAGRGTPSLVNRVGSQEAGSGSDRTGSTRDAAAPFAAAPPASAVSLSSRFGLRSSGGFATDSSNGSVAREFFPSAASLPRRPAAKPPGRRLRRWAGRAIPWWCGCRSARSRG